nr:MAG TPA: hypothetical protein [Bacteriophage sp.]
MDDQLHKIVTRPDSNSLTEEQLLKRRHNQPIKRHKLFLIIRYL